VAAIRSPVDIGIEHPELKIKMIYAGFCSKSRINGGSLMGS
jgi:hypothetical protein